MFVLVLFFTLQIKIFKDSKTICTTNPKLNKFPESALESKYANYVSCIFNHTLFESLSLDLCNLNIFLQQESACC